MVRIEWGDQYWTVAVNGKTLKTPCAAAGGIIERHLAAAGVEYARNWSAYYTASCDQVPEDVWTAIRTEVRAILQGTNEDPRTGKRCPKCGRYSTRFTTSRTVCDDCA